MIPRMFACFGWSVRLGEPRIRRVAAAGFLFAVVPAARWPQKKARAASMHEPPPRHTAAAASPGGGAPHARQGSDRDYQGRAERAGARGGAREARTASTDIRAEAPI